MITAALALQASQTQMQVATAVMKSSNDAQRTAVETLLGSSQQGSSSLANLGPGVGGNLNISA